MSTPPNAVAVQQSPAKPLNGIQLIEQEIVNFLKQRETAIANVHAVEGAIQAAQHLLAKLRAAEQEAVKAAEAAAKHVEADAEKVASEVKAEESKVVEFVKKEL